MVKLPEERLGQVLRGKVRLEGVAARGGIGVVYTAKHLKLGIPIAVKFLQWQGADEKDAAERMMAEARAASMLRHPNVVTIFDVDESEDGFAFIVMELLHGETLAARLARGSLSVDEAWSILRPVMDAVAVAHDSGIVHRDLKPENVFLHRNHKGLVVPKVLDFGAATLSHGSFVYQGTGNLTGTPLYMSPEQALGDIVDARSDVWSLAVLWYRCLTGHFPFDFDERSNFMRVVSSVQTDPIVPITQHLPGLPPSFAAVITRALSRDGALRPADASVLSREIGKALARESDWTLGEMALPSIPPPRAVSVRDYWPWVALSFACVVIIGLFAVRTGPGGGVVVLHGLPAHAAIYLDGELRGREHEGVMVLEGLAPHVHTIAVHVDGAVVESLEVSIGPGEHRDVELGTRRTSPSGAPTSPLPTNE